MNMKSFKKGNRVHHETMGYGTVSVDTYHTIHSTTWTCVTYDDYLGQKLPLCGETNQLTLVDPANKIRKYKVE